MTAFSINPCYISDKWHYNGMQVVWLENDLIKVGILVGRGADIIEFRYKPEDLNFLLKLPGEIKNPQKIFAQRRDTINESNTHFDLMWGQHIAFGLPYLKEGAQVEINAKKMETEPTMPDHRRFKPGIVTDWPETRAISGEKDEPVIYLKQKRILIRILLFFPDLEKQGCTPLRTKKKELDSVWNGMLHFMNTFGFGRNDMQLKMHPGGQNLCDRFGALDIENASRSGSCHTIGRMVAAQSQGEKRNVN